MSVRACLRAFVAGLCVWIGAVCIASPAAFAGDRPFTREDYESYFAPGRFATYSPYYLSNGTLEVVVNRTAVVAGQYVFEQTTRSLDVSANYDLTSRFDYYKIESVHTDQMVWSERRQAYVYDYTDKEFDADEARVWESNDNGIALSGGDLDRGELHRFYRDADKRAGRDAKVFDQDFRKEVVGVWSWSCAWVANGKFDVECKARHETSKRLETYLYRKLDLVG